MCAALSPPGRVTCSRCGPITRAVLLRSGSCRTTHQHRHVRASHTYRQELCRSESSTVLNIRQRPACRWRLYVQGRCTGMSVSRSSANSSRVRTYRSGQCMQTNEPGRRQRSIQTLHTSTASSSKITPTRAVSKRLDWHGGRHSYNQPVKPSKALYCCCSSQQPQH
jgi:hypothetical protein